MGFTVSDLPGLFDSHAFVTASPEDRKDVLDNVLSQSFQAMAEQQGFNQEQYRQFGEIAAASRDKLDRMQTVGETAKKYASTFASGAASIASALGGLAADSSFRDEDGNMRMPFGSTAEIAQSSVRKAGDTLSKWAVSDTIDAKALKGGLDELRTEIDRGFIPLGDEKKLDEWLTTRAGKLAKKQAEYYSIAGDVSSDEQRQAFAASNSIISPRNAALISRYISTRDPQTWAALEESIKETPTRAALNKEEQKSVEDSPVYKVLKGFEDLNGSVIPKGFAEDTVKGSGDPINIAATVLPMLRGAKLAQAAASGGKELAKRELTSLFKGAGEAVGIGEIGLDIQRPDASFQDHLQTGKNMIALSLGMHTAGRVINKTAEVVKARFGNTKDGSANGTSQDSPQSGNPNDPGGQQGPKTDSGSFDADAAVDEVFGAGTANAAKQQQQRANQQYQQQEQQPQPGNAPADDSGTGASGSSGEPPRESSGGTGGTGPAQQESSVAATAVAPALPDNPASRAAEQAAASGDHAAASVLAEVAKTVEQTKQTVAQQTTPAPPQVQQPQAPSAAPVQFGGQAPVKDVKPLKTAHVEGYTGRGTDASMAEFPVLNHINLNPIHLPPPGTESGKAGESRRWRENIGKYWHQFLFSPNPRALRVDQVAQLAYDNYNAQGQHVPLISAPTADALMEAVQREIGVRGSMRADIAKEKRRENLKLKQFKNFDKAAQSGDVPVTAGHVDLGADEYRGLMVGDELTVKGEKVEVTHIHEDEDGNVIGATLKDGPSYGVQEIGPDYVMLVDEFKPRQSKPGGEFVAEAEIEAAKKELQQKPEAATPTTDELLSSDTKTAEQIAAEKAAEAEKLQRMQDAQDIRVGAAKPLRAADDVLPENDMFDQSKNNNDLFSQPKPAPTSTQKPASSSEKPTLVSSNIRGSTIRLDFDATGKIPTIAALKEYFGGKVYVEQFAPNLISGTRGVVSFRLDAVDDKGRMSSNTAQEIYKNAFGSSDDYNGKSSFQLSGTLADRFTVGRAVAGDQRAVEAIATKNTRASQTGKNPLLTAKEQGLPPVAQAGHKASIEAAISLNEPFNAAEALRYGFQIPKGFTVDDNGIAHFKGVVEGIPNPDPKSIQPSDSDTAEQGRLKTAIANAEADLQAAMEDNDESGAAAIQRSIQTLTQRLAGLSREAPKAPMRELHEFTRDEAKALGKLKEHRAAVKMAFESGQTVPDDVLADYTDSKWAADEIKRRVESQQPEEPGKPRDAVEESLERAIDASQKRANARRKNTYSNPFAGIADDVWRDALKTALFIYRTSKSAAKAAKAAYDLIKSRVPNFRFTEADVQAALDKMHFATADTPLIDMIRGEWNDAVANLKAGFSAMKAKDMLAAAVDGADNAPSIPAMQAANHIRLRFGEDPTKPATDRVNVEAKLNEEGASFVTEAYRHVRSKKQAIADATFEAQMQHWAKTPGAPLPIKQTVTVTAREAKYALEQQGKRIESSQTAGDAKRYSPIIEHALQNFDELDKLRQYAHKFTDAQLALENQHGFDTKYTHDYIRRRYENIRDKRGWSDPNVMFDGGEGGTGGKTFMKGRVFDSVFDAMDAGYVPASMNIADLAESRIAAGQNMIEHKMLRDVLFGQKDATTNEPIIMEHSPGKPVNVNYKVVNMAGVEVQAHKRYAGLINSLYQPSVIRNSTAGRAMMKGNMAVKHLGLMVDTYHAGRVSFRQLAATGRMGYNRALALLEYMPADLAHLESIGYLTADEHAWALGKIGRVKELVHAGLNLNRLMDAVDREALSTVEKALQGIPVLGTGAKIVNSFNHWVFQKVTRGAMLEVAMNFYDHNVKKMPHGEALRLAAKETNEMFGNIGRQGIATSKTVQDVLRICFLAPQWTEGTLRSEMRGAAQSAEAAFKLLTTGKLQVGNSARVMLSTIAAVFLAGQFINYATKGHSTLENEEGHQSEVFIPGGKHGFYMSPFTFTNQYTEQFERYYVDNGGLSKNMGSKIGASLDALAQIVNNKLHPVFRAGKTLGTGHDYYGRPLPGFDRLVEAGKTMAFLPIPLNPVLKSNPGELPSITFEGSKPGAWQKQFFASVGIHLLSGEGPNQKMYALARPFRPDDMAKVPVEGKYTALRKDVSDGYEGYAWERMKELVASGEATISHMDESFGWHATQDGSAEFHPRMFTGNKEMEAKFLATLTPEQRQWHADAIAEQRQNAQTYRKIRNEHLDELRQLQKVAQEKKRQAMQSAP